MRTLRQLASRFINYVPFLSEIERRPTASRNCQKEYVEMPHGSRPLVYWDDGRGRLKGTTNVNVSKRSWEEREHDRHVIPEL